MNKHSIYNRKIPRNLPALTEKGIMKLSPKNSTDQNVDEPITLLFKIKQYIIKYKKPIIIIGAILIVAIIIATVVPLTQKTKHEENMVIKNIFSPAFKINSKEDTLTQLLLKSSQNYETIKNGEKSPYIIYTKGIFEIYTLNSSFPPEEDKIYYNKKYTSTITVNSICNKLSLNENESDCELETILDLNKRENKNLRRNEENEELIQKAILPICIIEHTDTNIIISLTCPDTISNSFKNDIIQAFQNIKPNSTRISVSGNNKLDITDIKGNNNIYIDIFNNKCSDSNINNVKSMKCNTAKNIITDRKGNLFSSIKKITKNIVYNENNIFSQNLTYDFQVLNQQNSSKFNPKIYKSNLNIFFSKTSSLMKKEIYINNFTSYFLELSKIQEENSDIRNIEEQLIENRGIQEENIFTKTIFDIPIELNIKNDIGLGKERKNAKAFSIYNINNDYSDIISFSNFQSNLNVILNEFISLSKSGNKLANQLNKELNEPLMKLKYIINEKIEQINNYLANKDLSEIFDSTNILKEIETLPYDFIPIIQNLSNSIDELGNDIYEIINDTMIILNNDIYDFLSDSHNLLNKLFNNLTIVTNALSSDENKIVEISSYYSNEKDTTYYAFINKIKNILDNYYKNEIENILPITNNIIEKFYEKTMTHIKRVNYKLDNISERLSKDDLKIIDSKSDERNKTLENIQHLKNKMNEIIISIKNKFEKIINVKENGFFETQGEIEEKIKLYEEIITQGLNISLFLDNNTQIDKIFDEVMSNFKNKFLLILKDMENILKEKFPLEENVLGVSLFDNIYLQKIDQSFKSEKSNIILFIQNENRKYLESMENIFQFFMNNNATAFDQLMSKLLNDLSEINLDNINKVYNESLTLTFKSINEIIENNKNLANEYLNNVNNANSYHITQGFINKYNTYINNHQTISSFISDNLKNNLENKYYNVINQINQLLQSIKSTNENIFEKYKKQLLPYSENHIKSIQILIERFNKHITTDNYIKKFLPSINSYITTTSNNLQNIKTNYENIYNNIAKKSKSDSSNDYDKQVQHGGDRYCCDRFLGFCIDHCRHPIYYTYDVYNAGGTNNHLNLKNIQFTEYIKNFDDKYNELYKKLSNDIISYNSFLPNLFAIIDNTQKEIIKTDRSDYTNEFQKKLDNIMEEKLGNNILQETYKYYKSEIMDALPNTLNTILIKWKDIYEELYNNITNNKNNFKSPLNNLYIAASSLIDIYNLNISSNYIETIVDKLKNEFNYTIKYYYNLINSKVNKTCSYIINNMPINEKPLDEILNIRYNEVNISCNNMINKIKNSKNEFVNKNKQKSVLNITSNNFFPINDIINSHINNFTLELNDKLNEIKVITNETNNKEKYNDEYILTNMYLENNINKKLINDIYDNINHVKYIDLQSDVYHNMINDVWKNEKEELNKNFQFTINEINNYNKNEFNEELEQYQKLLQNKIYKEFYPSKNLEEKINSMFSNGIKKEDGETKKKINEILESILNKVIYHLSNEGKRLSDEMTSYNNNFTFIEKRLNNYKIKIYNEFYSMLISKIDGFHNNIIEKFYNNYINKGLNEFQNYLLNATLGKAEFLNMSINLDEIINKELNILIKDYKNITLEQIEFLYQKLYRDLDELFSFSNIKSKINNEIDTYYNSKFLPILKREAIYSYASNDASYYDLSPSIINDIDIYIQQEIDKGHEIMKKMEGNQYEINEIFIANFSDVKSDIIDKIKNKFENYISIQNKKEDQEMNKTIENMISDNFEKILNDFISSFSVDFYDRILRFNEIQKINILYQDLNYVLNQAKNSYIDISKYNKRLNLPINLKDEILTLNNIESIIQVKNNELIKILKSKLNDNFNEEKSFIAQKYITDITLDPLFELNFNKKIIEKIKEKLNSNSDKIEEKFMEQMNKKIRDSFIQKYHNILNKKAEEINHIIENYKNALRIKFNNTFSFDSDKFLGDINKKLNDTNSSMELYKSHFNSFKISKEVINYFDVELINDIIIPKYGQLNDLLNAKSSKYVINNLDYYSNEYKKVYSINKFHDLMNITNLNFTLYIDKFTQILDNYGSTLDRYKLNLENEINKYNNKIYNNEEKLYNINIDIPLNELANISFTLEKFINNLDLFEKFEEKINNNIKEKNAQFEYSNYILNLNKDNNSYYETMIEKLNELNNISLEYYSEANSFYISMKEQIINNISNIDELIKACENITYEVITTKYQEIKNKYNKTNINETKIHEIITIPEYTYYDLDNNNIFGIETDINNYIINNIFTLDIIIDNSTKIPKVVGNLVNNIKPKSFMIDCYSSNGPTGKIGRKINIVFNDIFSYSNIIFDGKLNNATITTNFNFEEYSVKTQYYEEKVSTLDMVILGIHFVIPEFSTFVNVETPNNEKYYEIPGKNRTIIENYFY